MYIRTETQMYGFSSAIAMALLLSGLLGEIAAAIV